MTVIAGAAATGSGNVVSAHAAHALVGLGFFVAAVAVAALADRRQTRSARRPTSRRRQPLSWAAAVTAAGLLGAAGVHVAVTPEHFAETWVYGVFFVTLATLQVATAVLVLVRPSRHLAAALALANVAVVVLWAVSRTSGLPLGPQAGEVEAVGALDVLATGFELVVVAGCWALWRRHRARSTDLSVERVMVAGVRPARPSAPA
jgi:hypothetical protein